MVSKPEQDAIRAAYVGKVLCDLPSWIKRHQFRILATADARHDEGFESYGDWISRENEDDLEQDMIEEIADYINYACAARSRGMR